MRKVRVTLLLIILVGLLGGAGYWVLSRSDLTNNSTPEASVQQLQFDTGVSATEKATIEATMLAQNITITTPVSVTIKTGFDFDKDSAIVSAYVPLTAFRSARQSVSVAELKKLSLKFDQEIDEESKAGILSLLGITEESTGLWNGDPDDLDEATIVFASSERLDKNVKLLKLGTDYFLDDFSSGAVFREAVFSGQGSEALSGLPLNNLPNKETVLTVNQTGVTALTRLMMRKLSSVGDPLYFSKKIGNFLADADLTHVSNEVSFKKGCGYSDTLFCSPPEMIEVLKDSGVDIVELTGNHNNDVGSEYNTQSIKLYQKLGWQTIGGGLNTAEAAKYYVADKKGSSVAFLAYNYPDSPNGGAIAGIAKAGANSFVWSKIKKDIEAAKKEADIVIVDIQFWECYAYPNGYIEFPQCDGPIPNQTEVFRRVAGLGADMVVGISAHQPQTYELYKNSVIYYGLGNLYFDQDQWPGTERGIILTHYFHKGKLLQTKLSPTVYHSEYQTRLMDEEDAVELLDRLNSAL